MKNARWLSGHKAMWLVMVVLGGLLTIQVLAEVQGVFCREQKFWVVEDGATNEISRQIKLPYDVLVKTNGTFTVNSGMERQLLEGQQISPDGMLLSADGTIGPVYDHIAVKGGKVVVIRDGIVSRLAEPMPLPNGAVINPDSSMIKPGGMQIRLVDGQLFQLDGKPVAAKDTISMQKGRVVLQRDGALITLQPVQITEMSDGTRVTGAGLVTYRDGRRVQLAEGQILIVSGVAR